MSESNSTGSQQQPANKPPPANIIVQPQQVAQLPNAAVAQFSNAAGNSNIRYPLYVQAIPGSASPMIYSAVVGAGGATGAPQLVQWKATSSAAAHHPAPNVTMLPAMPITTATQQTSTVNSATATQMLAAQNIQALPPGLFYSVGGMPFAAGAGINLATTPIALISDQSKKDELGKGRESPGVMLAPPGKRIKPEHSHSNNPSPGPRPRSAENPSAVTLTTGAVPATAPATFIVPSVTAATAAMVTSKPQQWRNAGMKFISYTPTTVTTTTAHLSNNSSFKAPTHMMPTAKQVVMTTSNLSAPSSKATSSSDSITLVPKPTSLSQTISATMRIFLPAHLMLVIIPCFGYIPDFLFHVKTHLHISDCLQHLFKPCYAAMSNSTCYAWSQNITDTPLNPESCALLTISYLTSLRPGEIILAEDLRRYLYNAQCGELEWLEYYKKNKKMSENPFVQSFLMHLSRIVIYCASKQVRIMISNTSLTDGIIYSLKNLSQMASDRQKLLPNFVVVLALRQDSPLEFCIISANPLQVKALIEYEIGRPADRIRELLMKKRGRTHSPSSVGIPGSISSRSNKYSLKKSHSYNLTFEKKPLMLSKDVLTSVGQVRKQLNGKILVPFGLPAADKGLIEDKISLEEAEKMIPPFPHIVEHLPSGPFQEQYNVALCLMQQISNADKNPGLSSYRKVDFSFLVPSDKLLYSELVSKIESFSIVAQLNICKPVVEKVKRETIRRVICLTNPRDQEKLFRLSTRVNKETQTLFVVIIENAHLFHQELFKAMLNDSSNNIVQSSFETLMVAENVFFISVTSFPYSLISNHSMIPFSNEVYWQKCQSLSQTSAGKKLDNQCHNMTFCSSDDYLTENNDAAAVNDNGQVSYREDVVFEEQFQNVCCNAKEVDCSMDSLRAQLLLEQYVGAILTAVGQLTTKRIVSPDTQLMINELINAPLTNHKGQGLMVLLRCPDETVGQDLYQQLKAIRDMVGLQYRFEIIYNNTASDLELDNHFMRRLLQWKYGCVSSDQSQQPTDNQWQPNCFKDLENLPCLVILAGVCRSGLSFPRSLQYVDLRLCYSNNITRTVLEADMSYFNGYQVSALSKQTKLEKEESKDIATGKDKEVIDLSLDEEATNVSNEGSSSKISTKRLIIESSSSSRRSSIAEDNDRDKGGGDTTNGKIVEWKPSHDQDDDEAIVDDKHVTKPVHSPPNSAHSDSTLDGDEVIEVVSSPATPTDAATTAAAATQNEGEEPMQGSPTISEHSNASDYETEDADVTPPVSPAHVTSHDQGGNDDKSSEHIPSQHTVTDESGQGSMDTTDSQESSQEMEEPKEQKVTSTAKTKWEQYVNDMIKRIEENESDYSEEDSSPNKRVYLLSRTYHQIWNVSDYFNKRFLLEPAPGMEWSRSSKRPPLFDSDPQVQAAYYRKWATPTIIQCCEHCVLMSTSKKLVRSLGNVEKSGDRRFLLTGPAQVGKTGACLLLLRLLHDLTLSAHGVMVKNEPLAKKYLKQLKDSSAEPLTVKFDPAIQEYFKTKHFSKIFSVMSLHSKGSHEPEEVTDEEKEGEESKQPIEPKTEAYLSLSFNCTYDPTHSCNGCVLYMCRPHNSSTDTGIIRAEFTIDTPSPATYAVYIPMSQRKLFDIKTCSVTGKITVQRFILYSDVTRKNSKQVITPIFTPTFNRQAHALLNLHHAFVGAQHVHILVMNASQVANYQKVWPNHIILILPEGDKSQGYGPTLYWIKLFATHNYTLNCTAMAELLSSKVDPLTVWPWIIIMNDSCVMWKKSIVEPNGTRRYASSSLTEVIQSVERSIEGGMPKVAAIGFLQWSKEIKDVPTVNMTSDCQISHSLIFLDISKTTAVNYNQFNYNSADLDFNLRVVSEGLQLLRDNRFLVVKKKLEQGGNMYPSYLVQKLPNTPQSDIDQMVFSLHYDALRLLPFPGPYLMEEYLINRSTTLFPNAIDKQHPVLVFENFVNLGPEINIVYIGAKTVSELDSDHPTDFQSCLEHIQFGGLLLYLSEGKINIVNRLLPFLNFVNGATLCLITRDCKSLVKEKARLDIENKWKFQAKGEHQTACPDDHRPLFFLTGHLVQDSSDS